MCMINKEDYFVGVFVSVILKSSKGVPALFDATGNNKRVEFTTEKGDFNVYIKYSTNLRKSMNQGKKISCNVSFSSIDYNYLKNSFLIDGKKNLICLVCTNKELNQTKLALLDYNDAMNCLKNQTKTGNKRITVTKTGKMHNFFFYGVQFKKNEYIKSPASYTSILALD